MAFKGMLFVQGEDRPGIIKTITGVLFDCKANLEDVSMTLLENQFAMMVSFNADDKAWKKIDSKILVLRKEPWKMHTHLISISSHRSKGKQPAQSILISAIGKDRTGIVHRLSSDLSKLKANITNLDCRLLQRSKGASLYSMVLEVDLPTLNSLKKIKGLISVWQKELGVEIKTHTSEAAVF